MKGLSYNSNNWIQEKSVDHAHHASFATNPLLTWNLHHHWNSPLLVHSQQRSCVHSWSRCQRSFFTVILCNTSKPTSLVYKGRRTSSLSEQKTSISFGIQNHFLCLITVPLNWHWNDTWTALELCSQLHQKLRFAFDHLLKCKASSESLLLIYIVCIVSNCYRLVRNEFSCKFKYQEKFNKGLPFWYFVWKPQYKYVQVCMIRPHFR